jgi:DNA-binding transcriptional LysR family regulator
MDLNLLTVFEAVARTTSFSTAARELHLPRSSVSRAIARLESELGVQLLFRTTRQVTLSAVGTTLYDRVVPHLGSVKAALGELPEREEQPSGELRVTAPMDLGLLFLPEVVVRYTARYPAVSVSLALTSQMVDLVAEGIDVALRVSPPLKDSTLVARPVATLVLQLVASPLYLARRGTPRTEADLDGHDWVLFEAAARKVRLNGPRGPVEVVPHGRIQCDDMLFVRNVLRAGAGIGLLPAFVADPEVAGGSLVRVLPRYEQLGGRLYVVSPAARHVPRRVVAFRDLVFEVLKLRPLGTRAG